MNQQKLRKLYKEEVALELRLRAQAARKLSQARNQLRGGMLGADKQAAVEASIAQWDQEVRERSEVIARKQGYLSDQRDAGLEAVCAGERDYQVGGWTDICT